MAAPKGNRYAIGNKGGREPFYSDPEVLSRECDEYFFYILGEWHFEMKEFKNKEGESDMRQVQVWDREPEPATITGLALYLGFSGRKALFDYKLKEDFSNIIKKAVSRVEHSYEKGLHSENVTGKIFALKNMGWKDKQEVEQTVTGSIEQIVTYKLPEKDKENE